MQPTLEVCLSPLQMPLVDLAGKNAVVIDILRASSTITTALSHNIQSVIPVGSVEDCRNYTGDNLIKAAERGGKMVEGFLYGNSPYEYMDNNALKGMNLVLTTTNGTRVVELAKQATDVILAGSFLNLTAIAAWLKNSGRDTVLLCAGWKDRFSLEDSLCAGAIAHKLENDFEWIEDPAYATAQMYRSVSSDLIGAIRHSSHYKRLSKNPEGSAVEKDTIFCAHEDVYQTVPIYKGTAFVKAV